MLVLIGIGLAAGFITAISPCVLPVLPIIFAGGATGSRRKPFAIIAGLIVSFTAFTLFGVWLLKKLGLPEDFLRNLAIALLFLVAATLLFPKVEEVVQKPFLRLTRRPGGELGGGFLLGASLGLVFVPCAGPVLAAITVVGATQDVGARAIVLTLAYATGAAIPMLMVAFGGRAGMTALRPHAHRIRQVLGVVGRAHRARDCAQRRPSLPDRAPRLHGVAAEEGGAERRTHKASSRSSAARRACHPTRRSATWARRPSFAGLSHLDQQQAADAPAAARKGRPRRLLDVLVHQLPADAPAREGLVPDVRQGRARRPRRAHARVRVRARPVQRPRSRAPTGGHVPGRARQRLQDLERVPEPVLAGEVPDRPSRPPALRPLRRGRVRHDRGADPHSARRERGRCSRWRTSSRTRLRRRARRPSRTSATSASTRFSDKTITADRFATYHFPDRELQQNELSYAGRWRVTARTSWPGPARVCGSGSPPATCTSCSAAAARCACWSTAGPCGRSRRREPSVHAVRHAAAHDGAARAALHPGRRGATPSRSARS